MKKEMLFLLAFFFIFSFVSAAEFKIEVTTIKESYQPGENISLKVDLLDSSNVPLSGDVNLVFSDAEKTSSIESSVKANSIESVSLGDSATPGYWTIDAYYEDSSAQAVFVIEAKELARFDISGDMLTITNIGNDVYSKKIQIIIGETVGTKDVTLNVGDKTSFRLIAPSGVYNIKVTDGTTSIVRGGVSLTGEVIGILDDKLKNRVPITGARIDTEEKNSTYEIMSANGLVYLFVAMLIGAAILVAIERKYTRKLRVE